MNVGLRCASCGHENAAGARFCGNCGLLLRAEELAEAVAEEVAAAAATTCPRCGADNPPEAAFCGNCGASLISGHDIRDTDVFNVAPAAGALVPSNLFLTPLPRESGLRPAAEPAPFPSLDSSVQFADFGLRFRAGLADGAVLAVGEAIAGSQWLLNNCFLLSYAACLDETGIPVGPFLLPLLYYVLFTGVLGQTPGKMLVRVKVVDSRQRPPGLARTAVREVFGKAISVLGFGVGLLWVVFDRKKRGWHDHIADTYVIKV